MASLMLEVCRPVCKMCARRLRLSCLRNKSGLVRQNGLRRFSTSSDHDRKVLSSQEIRKTFLDFYKVKYDHLLVPSSSVVPRNDPTLLFINAGMNQFKPLIQGTVDPRSDMAKYRRVVNSQKCIRAGGKHNDLEDVGRDCYHHTVFEMLGNWSFGDFFKREACAMTWELLTDVYRIPADRLYVTYFGGDPDLGLEADLECREIWASLGVPAARILPCGMRDNFWEMGDVGPCGPCTEIHYDHRGQRDASRLVNTDSPEVVELWNLVFMQFNRESDGTLRPLPRHVVDTGMGLERLVAVMQGKLSNYDTDLFSPLLHAIHKGTKVQPYSGLVGGEDVGGVDEAYRIIADHVRTLTIAIADGVMPGQQWRELVLRTILRRAVRYAQERLGAPEGLVASLVPVVVQNLGEAFPELLSNQEKVMDTINEDEALFLSNLEKGKKLMSKTIRKLDKSAFFPSEVGWFLHNSLGLPTDLVQSMVTDRGCRMDMEHYSRIEGDALQKKAQGLQIAQVPTLDAHSLQQLQALGVPPTDNSLKYNYRLTESGKYDFPSPDGRVLSLYRARELVDSVGPDFPSPEGRVLSLYRAGELVDNFPSPEGRVLSLYTEGQLVANFPSPEGRVLSLYMKGELVGSVGPGDVCSVILDRSCFYPEAGGQESDQGNMTKNEVVVFTTDNVQVCGGYVLHQGQAQTSLTVDDTVQLNIDQERRLSCMQRHTATHLLNHALREVLGEACEQRGSHVGPNRLRFDFSVKSLPSPAELRRVEETVQAMVDRQECVYTREVSLTNKQTNKQTNQCFYVSCRACPAQQSSLPSPAELRRVEETVQAMVDRQECVYTRESLPSPAELRRVEETVQAMVDRQECVYTRESLPSPVELRRVEETVQTMVDRQECVYTRESLPSPVELRRVEETVQTMVDRQECVYTREVPLSQAKEVEGIRTMDEACLFFCLFIYFQEYPDPVRVVSVGTPVEELMTNPTSGAASLTSVELCCGTHVHNTASIKAFVISYERRNEIGSRRIIAVTGDEAVEARKTGAELEERAKTLERLVLQEETSSLEEMEGVYRDVGKLIRRVDTASLPLWKRLELQVSLDQLQSQANRAVKKLRQQNVETVAQKVARTLVDRNEDVVLVTDTGLGPNLKVLRTTVRICSELAPDTPIMLFGTDPRTASVRVACKVPEAMLSRGLGARTWLDQVMADIKAKGRGDERSATAAGGNPSGTEAAITAARRYAHRVLR
ncbi:alanine--tRNA ligase, mitochondrial-like [Branchiostoma floridae]|uniref:Alanine--tRNA ligase n=1 Tax=Branchiostoma floridae TaxID=7739 RepID=A0A9J7MZJ7_BRAFL|nr:alanine--tRNA ligase, mitochondrial-like [Branchiostoma floridae]